MTHSCFPVVGALAALAAGAACSGARLADTRDGPPGAAAPHDDGADGAGGGLEVSGRLGDQVIAELDDRVDPTHWELDAATGFYFRSTTKLERARNQWLPGSYLLGRAGLFGALAGGVGEVALPMPVARDARSPLTVVPLVLRWSSSRQGLEFIERRAEAGRLVGEKLRPTFHKYWTPTGSATAGRVAGLIASDLRGGLWMRAYVDGFVYPVRQSAGGATLEVPAPPGLDLVVATQMRPGTAAIDQCMYSGLCDWLCADLGGVDEDGQTCGDNPHLDPTPDQCHDGLQNDVGDGVDGADLACQHHDAYDGADFHCDDYAPGHRHPFEFGKYFMYMGNGPWCKRAADDHFGAWWVPAFALSQQTAAFMATVNPAPTVSLAQERLRFVGAGCWLFDTYGDAYNCTYHGTCPAGFEDYPYVNARNLVTWYTTTVWDDVRHGVAIDGLDLPVQLAQVLYYGPNAEEEHVLKKWDAGSGTWKQWCGFSEIIDDYERGSIADTSALVSTESHCPSPTVVSVHEYTHDLTIGHEPAGLTSYMASDGGAGAPWLSAANYVKLGDCMNDDACPRPSGF